MKLLKSISIFILVFSTQVTYQQWIQTSGPEGGNVYAVALSGGILFAGLSPGGVYRSTDLGGNWVQCSSGFLSGDDNVQALYSYNNIIYAGTRSWLYSSADNGNNWSRVPGFMGSEVTDIKSSGSYLYAATYGGVTVSSDNGISWVMNNNGLTNLYTNALVLKDNKLILATEGGAFISSDNGINWVNISSGLTQLNINDMTRKGNDIYAATAVVVYLNPPIMDQIGFIQAAGFNTPMFYRWKFMTASYLQQISAAVYTIPPITVHSGN